MSEQVKSTKTRTTRRVNGTMDHWPQTSEERIEAFRSVVSERQYAKIDGHMVDLFAASIVVKVFDGLNETNKARLGAMTADHAMMICLKVASGAVQ